MSPRKDDVIDIAAKLTLSPDAWSSLEPVRRRNRIAEYRKFIQKGVDRAALHSEEIDRLLSSSQQIDMTKTLDQLIQEAQEEADEKLSNLTDPTQIKVIIQTLQAKLQYIKHQYAEEVKRTINLQNECKKIRLLGNF